MKINHCTCHATINNASDRYSLLGNFELLTVYNLQNPVSPNNFTIPTDQYIQNEAHDDFPYISWLGSHSIQVIITSTYPASFTWICCSINFQNKLSVHKRRIEVLKMYHSEIKIELDYTYWRWRRFSRSSSSISS